MTDQQFATLLLEIRSIRERLDDHIDEAAKRSADVAVLMARIPTADAVERRMTAMERSWAKLIGVALGGGALGSGAAGVLWRTFMGE